jgi:hypothetical protein
VPVRTRSDVVMLRAQRKKKTSHLRLVKAA